ncbi:MAG: MBL fold metallo-hydrolase [Acidimicrobiia bacterium]|nr:MBL fold metallo-hydrolase [Acidimicrobiia bacterium]
MSIRDRRAALVVVLGFALLAAACGDSATRQASGTTPDAPPGATPDTAPGATSRTRLVTLGTAGGPLPTANRAQASNLLTVDGKPYLIDAGDGVLRRIVQSGANFREIDQIFITHPHSDHMLGLATVLVIGWEYQHRGPIEIYGPPGTEAIVAGAIQYATINFLTCWTEGKRTPMEDVFHARDVTPGVVFTDDRVTVTAVENSHFQFPEGTPAYGKAASYSYRFDTPDRSIVFTGDTGPSEAVTALAQGVDLLVSEVLDANDAIEMRKRNGSWQEMSEETRANWVKHLEEEHMRPEQVARMAAAAGVKTLIFSHVPPTGPGDRFERYVEEAQRFFSGPIIVAEDLQEF